jgi:HAL2 family 3'(2'),5'-bisphosphate nucleotidase
MTSDSSSAAKKSVHVVGSAIAKGECMRVHPLVEQLLGAEAVEALRLVWDAVRLARVIQHETRFRAFAKADGSPVTIADLAVYALVRGRLACSFPHDSLIAEEDPVERDGALLRSREPLIADLIAREERDVTPQAVASRVEPGRCRPDSRCWVLDPVDGTKGFIAGRQYAVALALVVNSRLAISLLGCPCYSPVDGLPTAEVDRGPAAGGVAIAVHDRGAWWITPDGRDVTRLAVSCGVDIHRARVLTSHEHGHTNSALLERTLMGLGISTSPVPLDSQAKHVVLAAGRADALLRFPTPDHPHENIWDHAAGALLIAEAGGRITDLAGQPLDFSTGRQMTRNCGIVASNGELHDAVLEALRPTLEEAPAKGELCVVQGR